MATSSILGGSAAPQRPRGTGADLLGPSDSSDSGSDVQGERTLATDADDGGTGAVPAELDSDTDARGTGERAAAAGSEPRDGDDILPDRVIRTADALDDADRLEVDELVADEPELGEAGDEDASDDLRH
ncbi:hypothetical protein [Piscinibacter gummiphilus]|uniref:Chemotaxis protein n=1 Tax=Piscinibacter gummiphilus TaxID=946333 RepID=A0ABZ0D6D0_9BURK|nr:hypothetical protein [Piscinibacter gummiphilus]WOB10827.1 hypothetical protein RXV79_12415 [Piscinibacter gummiphilus]